MPKHKQLLLHIIANYVPETNMPMKLGICKTYTKYRQHIWGWMYIYVPHMKHMHEKTILHSDTDTHTYITDSDSYRLNLASHISQKPIICTYMHT